MHSRTCFASEAGNEFKEPQHGHLKSKKSSPVISEFMALDKESSNATISQVNSPNARAGQALLNSLNLSAAVASRRYNDGHEFVPREHRKGKSIGAAHGVVGGARE